MPLSRPDADLTLALQPLVDAIYERGRYREEIDYRAPLALPLNTEQTAWLARHLLELEREAKAQPRRSRRSRK